ncbi:MAG TPA: hypothetical protein VLX28_09400 [Thermoanaerobaculia bacterium]|nr:hypothetical protein [Thermoanaerobaculia bacterium]
MEITGDQRRTLGRLARMARPKAWPSRLSAWLSAAGLGVRQGAEGGLVLDGLPALELGRSIPGLCGPGAQGCGPARVEGLEITLDGLAAAALKPATRRAGPALQVEALVEIPRLLAAGTFQLHQACTSGREGATAGHCTWQGAFELVGRRVEIFGRFSIDPAGRVEVEHLAAAADRGRSRLTVQLQGLDPAQVALANSLLALDYVKDRLVKMLNQRLLSLVQQGALIRVAPAPLLQSRHAPRDSPEPALRTVRLA